MNLYLIRHAIAELRREGLPDAERQLTDKGRARFFKVVEGLAKAGVQFDCVYHSPWARAVQTAEMLRPIVDGKYVSTEGLASPPIPEFFASLSGTSVACVGHEPWMSDAVALLTLNDDDGSWMKFKKGGVAWLIGNPADPPMELQALWPPRLFRALG